MLFRKFLDKYRLVLGVLTAMLLASYGGQTYAAVTLDEFVKNIQNTFKGVIFMMNITAYMCGTGFLMIGLFKFKAYKDNPAQIPLSTPFALMAIGSGLLFLPTVFEIAGSAVFGGNARSGKDLLKTGDYFI